MAVDISRVASEKEFGALKALFLDYAAELGVEVCFREFENELANLEAHYDAAFLAGAPPQAAGCIALKRHTSERCEIKRLYVMPGARETGLGKRLAEAAVAEARARGYREIILESLERLERALAMYGRMGFARCGPHAGAAEPEVVYMRLAL